MKYFEKHAGFNGLMHVFLGVGIGFLLTYIAPIFYHHAVRSGFAFIALGMVGHVWAATHKP